VSAINFEIPKWVEVLNNDHWLKDSLINTVRDTMNEVDSIKDIQSLTFDSDDNEYIKKIKLDKINLADGSANVDVKIKDEYYYKVLSDLIGSEITGEYQLISLVKKLGNVKNEYEKIEKALYDVSMKGYGIVTPQLEQLALEEPQIVKQGNRYGVKLKASAPTIHMIKCDIQTEVSPIVGTEQQSEEFLSYLMSEYDTDPKSIWQSNIFGKSLNDLVNEGLQNKIYRMPEETQVKMQETLQKILNESNGGVVCIII
jgi:stage IV sporulation protein A